ncbi:hypothetical protein V5740_07990 [Croceibacterium sp. TMG7-5b_MA50]|uniref:hypothetical protein n=1 Tax=Croceibacterium sp. TMG7-5b_MA50 TaxID=3121290 RepID=UPI00322198BB
MAVRNDISSLLARLGRTDLQYREFADPLGDMEMWPIFEALLQDPRIVGRAPTLLDQRRRGHPPAARHPAEASAAMDTPAPTAPPQAAAVDPQVRAFSGQLGAQSRRHEGSQ